MQTYQNSNVHSTRPQPIKSLRVACAERLNWSKELKDMNKKECSGVLSPVPQTKCYFVFCLLLK